MVSESTNRFLISAWPNKFLVLILALKIFNQTKNTYLAHHADVADTPKARMVGLLNRDNLPDGHALLITQCRSIHMFFMRFSIDAVFIDRRKSVVGVVENIKPFQMSPIFFRASSVIELPAGTVYKTGTTKGDQLTF